MMFSNGFKEIFLKKTLKDIDTTVLMWILSWSTLLIVSPFLLKTGFPEYSHTLALSIVFWGALYFVGKYCYFKALEYWEISYIAPLKGITTINIVFTSWILLWELPSFQGLIGIIVIIVWVYVLSIQKGQIYFLEPIKYLFKNKWSQMFLVTTVAYGISVSIDKIWVLESSPFFRAFCMNGIIFVSVLPQMIKKLRSEKKKMIDIKWWLLFVIILHVVAYMMQMFAFEYLLAAYHSAFKTSSALVSIVVWGVLFKEKDLKKKFLAGLIICWGIVLIALS